MRAQQRIAVRTTERQLQALELCLEGMSTDGIAAELGIRRATVIDLINRALASRQEDISERVDQIRAVEAERLDRAAAALLPRVLEGDARAQDTWLRNRQRLHSLLGLDLRPPDVQVDASQNVIVLPAWGEQQAQAVDGEARELETGDAP